MSNNCVNCWNAKGIPGTYVNQQPSQQLVGRFRDYPSGEYAASAVEAHNFQMEDDIVRSIRKLIAVLKEV